jgi:hypothetical protein
MNRLFGRHCLKISALAWLTLQISMGAGSAGMPPPAVQGQTAPQAPAHSCSVKVPEPAPVDLTTLAKIPADKAMAAALATYPGSRVRKVALENENGCLVYSVLLSNGLEVTVDAGNGQVLRAASEDDEDYHESQGRTKK